MKKLFYHALLKSVICMSSLSLMADGHDQDWRGYQPPAGPPPAYQAPGEPPAYQGPTPLSRAQVDLQNVEAALKQLPEESPQRAYIVEVRDAIARKVNVLQKHAAGPAGEPGKGWHRGGRWHGGRGGGPRGWHKGGHDGQGWHGRGMSDQAISERIARDADILLGGVALITKLASMPSAYTPPTAEALASAKAFSAQVDDAKAALDNDDSVVISDDEFLIVAGPAGAGWIPFYDKSYADSLSADYGLLPEAYGGGVGRRNNIFSNYYPAKMLFTEDNGMANEFATAQGAFLAGKYLDNPAVYNSLQEASTRQEIEAVEAPMSDAEGLQWTTEAQQARMLQVLRTKFVQNPELAADLRRMVMSGYYFVFDNRGQLDRHGKRIADGWGLEGEGKNLLGQLLRQVGTELIDIERKGQDPYKYYKAMGVTIARLRR